MEIDSTAKTVRMERDDGIRFTLDWDRLSEDDQKRLAAAITATQRAPGEHIKSIPLAARTEEQTLPESFILKDVPMIVQKGNYCVPASAAMIAGFHDIKTDQDQVAELSSEMSANNEGTYPSDMLLAMEKLGFNGQALHWEDEVDFLKNALPEIRRALVNDGPVYVSFRPRVFGIMGHGCVIVGYNDRRGEIYFYNPWGNEFEKEYETLGLEGYGVVLIQPPTPAPVATDEFVTKIQGLIPIHDGNFLVLAHRLKQVNQAHELVWCSRRDARDDRNFARDTARDDGRKILELAFERNPAVLIPYSENGISTRYQFVTRPPEGGAQFLVRSIDQNGWSEPTLQTLGSLTRHWVTAFDASDSEEKVWELPMIELHPDTTL